MIQLAQRKAVESLLGDEDAATRELVIREIVSHPSEGHAEIIRQLVRSRSPRVREACRRILSAWQVAHPEDVPPIPGSGPCLQEWCHLEKFCWALARLEYPGLNEEGHARTLDAWAARAREVAQDGHAPAEVLRQVLAGEQGLRGNRTNYYDPANSYLNCVLETRLGIPLTLSLAYILVARRLGWDVWGVNTPGHYLVSVDGCVIDPYFGGVVISPESMAERFEMRVELCRQRDFMRATPVGTAQRMLANLLNCYLKQGDDGRYRRINAYLKILQENSV